MFTHLCCNNDDCGVKLKDHLMEKMGIESGSDELMINSGYLPTVVVCGPRGAGKSTLVTDIFCTMRSVVKVSYTRENC